MVIITKPYIIVKKKNELSIIWNLLNIIIQIRNY